MSHTSRHSTPPTGPNAPRVRSRATAAAALFVVASVLAGQAPAHAADPSPSPTPSPTATVAVTPTLEAAATSFGALRAGDALRVDATVTNPTGTALTAGTAHVSLGTTALADAAAMDAWLGGEDVSTPFVGLTPQAVADVAAGASLSVPLTSTPADTAVTALTPGTYPLVVTYASGTTSLTARTIVTVSAAATPTAVLVPITTEASSEGLLSLEALQALTGPDGDLTAVLDGVSSAPQALIAVDPAIVASIRVLGSAAPASAREWLHTLEQLPNERITLQFADADVTTQFAAGLPAPLQATSFGWALNAANFASEDAPSDAPTPSPTASPTLSPTAGEVVLPTTAQLQQLDADFAAWWPADGSTDAQTLAAAGDQTAVLLSSATTGQSAGHVTLGGADVLSYDADVASSLSLAAAEPDEQVRAGLLARASALVRFQAAGAGGNPLFVALDRGTDWDAAALSDALAALSEPGVTQTISAGSLRATPAVPGTLAETAADAGRVAALTGMIDDERRLTTFATVLSDPDLLLGRERARNLRLLSVAWVGDERAEQAVHDQHARVNTILQSVELIQPTQITQVSSGSNIPMFVRNDLPFDVSVAVITTSNDVRLQVQERTEVVAPANSTARVSIPVTARISNGEVRIALQLQSLGGVPIGASKHADVTIRAEWEGIGLGVFAGLVVLLLVFGTFRMIRRRRTGAEEPRAKRPSRQERRAEYRAPAEEPSEDEERG